MRAYYLKERWGANNEFNEYEKSNEYNEFNEYEKSNEYNEYNKSNDSHVNHGLHRIQLKNNHLISM